VWCWVGVGVRLVDTAPEHQRPVSRDLPDRNQQQTGQRAGKLVRSAGHLLAKRRGGAKGRSENSVITSKRWAFQHLERSSGG